MPPTHRARRACLHQGLAWAATGAAAGRAARGLAWGVVTTAASAQAATPAAAGSCGDGAPPAWPAPGQPPLLHAWLAGGRQDGPAPDCSALPARPYALLLRLVATLQAPADADALALRLGAVSTHTGMRYWSFSDRQRLVLVRQAHALDNLAQRRPRPDFSLAELRSGAPLHFEQTDNRASAPLAYTMRLIQAAPDRLRLLLHNASDLRWMGLTLLAAHELQWQVDLQHLGAQRWAYLSLLGVQRLRLGSADSHRLSHLSRLVAQHDHLAGVSTEVERWR